MGGEIMRKYHAELFSDVSITADYEKHCINSPFPLIVGPYMELSAEITGTEDSMCNMLGVDKLGDLYDEKITVHNRQGDEVIAKITGMESREISPAKYSITYPYKLLRPPIHLVTFSGVVFKLMRKVAK
jgi:hypothetical protein